MVSTKTSPAPSAPGLDAARSRQVELILEGVDGLPTLSPVAARVISIGSADEVDIDEITKVIESDPAMSTRVLGLCRRADKGLGDRVTTVKRAVVMLGIEAVRAAVLSVSVYDLLGNSRHEAPDDGPPRSTFDRAGFWRYSLGVACASELIASQSKKLNVKPEEAFIAGLLHAIGKTVLDVVLPRAYAKVLALAERHAQDTAPVERQVIGLDHHTAGKRVGEHWQLPQTLREVMWLCGQPYRSLPESSPRSLIWIVTAARAVCRHLHLGWSGDFGAPPDVGALCREVGLVDAKGEATIRTDALAESLHAAISDRCKALGLEETTTPVLLLESLSSANRQLAKLNGALEERGRHSMALSRVLDEIVAFTGRGARATSLTETFGEIVRSASAILGPGFYAILHQPAGSTQWHLFRFPPGQRVGRAELVEPPGRDETSRSLAALVDPTHLNVMAMGLLPWLADYLIGAPDLRRLRLLPMYTGATGSDGIAETAGVLIGERELTACGLAPAHARALLASWATAVLAAARHEHMRHMGEELVQLNRSLTETQARLTEAESLARLGEMTAGAAHEMNNPLTVISGQGQLLAGRLRDLKDKSAASQIVEAAQALTGLISSLHTIAAPPTPSPVRVELAWAIREGVELARQRLGTIPSVELDLAAVPTLISVDTRLFAQALGELVANAAEADPNGPLIVQAAVDPLEEALLVRVIDRGPGLSPKAQQHAFDAFFSERPSGRSRGLGLTRARSLAQAMGGEITLGPNAGRGTIATLSLRGSERASPQER